jgi:putative ABC transport system permease protein
MSRFLFLAWQYVRYHRIKSLILIACITLTVSLPVCISVMLSRFNDQIVARSQTTPLVIGAKGSRFDLALYALYFRGQVPDVTSMSEVRSVRASGYANPIPLYIPATAKGFPVIGTDIEYFSYRHLSIDDGQSLSRIGQCVIGNAVSKKLGLSAGDSIITDSENPLGLTADYPLKMQIVGVLNIAHSPDDQAVFVDMKTAWVISGIGHGHEDVATADKNKMLSTEDGELIASAAILPYNEITDANIGAFHFHGDPKDFPVSAIIADPLDDRSATLLQGDYIDSNKTAQIIKPAEVIEQLMAMIFKIKQLFDANAVLIAISTILLLVLVVLLSLKLRQREMETMYKIGCSRSTVWMLQIGELAIVTVISLVLVAIIVFVTVLFGESIIQSMFFSQVE